MITYNDNMFLLTKRQCRVRGKDLLRTTVHIESRKPPSYFICQVKKKKLQKVQIMKS